MPSVRAARQDQSGDLLTNNGQRDWVVRVGAGFQRRQIRINPAQGEAVAACRRYLYTVDSLTPRRCASSRTGDVWSCCITVITSGGGPIFFRLVREMRARRSASFADFALRFRMVAAGVGNLHPRRGWAIHHFPGHAPGRARHAVVAYLWDVALVDVPLPLLAIPDFFAACLDVFQGTNSAKVLS